MHIIFIPTVLVVSSVLGLYHSLSLIVDYKAYFIGSVLLVSFVFLLFIYATIFLFDSYEYHRK